MRPIWQWNYHGFSCFCSMTINLWKLISSCYYTHGQTWKSSFFGDRSKTVWKTSCQKDFDVIWVRDLGLLFISVLLLKTSFVFHINFCNLPSLNNETLFGVSLPKVPLEFSFICAKLRKMAFFFFRRLRRSFWIYFRKVNIRSNI